MLPIVNADVKGEKVSIYNPAVQAKHPLYGLRFTNTTDLYLMQGPITVFDGGVYAGDAKIEDLPPGSQRLISYGLDLDTEVAPQSKSRPEELLERPAVEGHDDRRPQVRPRASSTRSRTRGSRRRPCLIEYPIDPQLDAGRAQGAEGEDPRSVPLRRRGQAGRAGQARGRGGADRPAAGGARQLDDNSIRFYLSAKVVSEKVKAALAELVKRKHEIAAGSGRAAAARAADPQIGEDQARIRQNMAQLDRNSDIYKSYVKKFSDQEAEIEKLRDQIAELTATGDRAAEKSLDEYLMGLDLQ